MQDISKEHPPKIGKMYWIQHAEHQGHPVKVVGFQTSEITLPDNTKNLYLVEGLAGSTRFISSGAVLGAFIRELSTQERKLIHLVGKETFVAQKKQIVSDVQLRNNKAVVVYSDPIYPKNY